jgi:hypothetical protein
VVGVRCGGAAVRGDGGRGAEELLRLIGRQQRRRGGERRGREGSGGGAGGHRRGACRRARGGHALPSIPTTRGSQLLGRCATRLRTTAGGLLFCVRLPSPACAQKGLYADADGQACWRPSYICI